MSLLGDIGDALSFSGVGGLLASALSANEISASNEAAKLQSEQLESQTLSKEYQQVKGRNREIDALHLQLSKQQAINYNRGLSGDSPSFNAIQMNTFNQGATALQNSQIDSHITELSEKAGLSSIDNQRKERNESIYWGNFKQVLGIAIAAAGVIYHG